MRIPILPAVVLLLVPALGFAADPMTPTPMPPKSALSSEASKTSDSPSGAKAAQSLNQEIRAVTAAFDKTRQCFELEDSLKADLAGKKASLAAEFKGKMPPAFNDLLWQKTQRVAKQHASCFQQYEELGKMFTALHTSFRTIEPKNQNVKKQKDEVDALKEKYLLMMPTAKPYNKTPKPKQVTE
ncbi:MAG: hypothetical protein PHS14_13310 [Elusimicrobia bacterium]|nr:hypothetical protein [Elusimicrobiota bacterium]